MTPYADEEGTWHEEYTAKILVYGQNLGEVTYDSGREDLRWCRDSYALFCPTCGFIWARIIAQNSKERTKMYDVWKVSCLYHTDEWNIPGSLLARHLIHLLDDMPAKVVEREFRLLLAQADPNGEWRERLMVAATSLKEDEDA